MKIAFTIDELLLWEGTPMPRGYTPSTVLRGVVDALREHEVAGAYAFPHTQPIAADPSRIEIIESWVDAGHHIGNHTHHHACLNWLEAEAYCDDIERAEEFIGEFVEQAPTKYFRYAMDMTGRSEAKRGQVEDFLTERGYVNAPITAWFGDFAWTAPYARAIDTNDAPAVRMLRETYVDAAVAKLQEHAAGARRLFGTDIPYIWLIHGTPPAQDLLVEILDRFRQLGAEFVTLEEAMRHPAHRSMPPVSGKFRNHLQRFGIPLGDEFGEVGLETLLKVTSAALPEGENPMAVYDSLIDGMVARSGGVRDWEWA
ncbi:MULTISPECIES: polysaccharide deacetylase family protein [unclassified Aeromicrobium]|uniref:polysaccharide deacetylase family protein n=1 Tax=unclassified Aeromicrobium TaxID=2633570 RepID=UPI00396B13FF